MNNGERIKDMVISDGSVIMTSERGEVRIGKMSAARRLSLGLPVDLNQASVADLTLIPGIGEKTARQIIELRKQKGTLQDVSDLTEVPGIKIRKLNRLKEYLIVGQGP
jgi:competence protein ComEA